jgi:hypothetical protein
MRRLLSSVAFLIAATFLSLASRIEAGDLSGVPAKIEIAETSVPDGTIKLALVDPANSPAPARRDLQVEIQTKSENGEVGTSIVTIKRGQTEATGSLPIKGTGIVEVTARHPRLAQAGTVVDVPKAGTHETKPSPTVRPTAKVAPLMTAEPAASTAGVEPTGPAARAPEHRPVRARAGSAMGRLPTMGAARAPADEHSARDTAAPAAAPSPSPEDVAVNPSAMPPPPAVTPVAAASGTPPALKLSYYPTIRKLRADEHDPATVCATLPSDWPAPTDFSVYLMSDVGPLTPEPIKIPAGKVRGEGKLVATRPGVVQVWYEYSMPPATPPADPLKIEFTHPVWAPKLVPTSPKVTLFDSVDVAVELVNYDGTSVPADEDRKVNIRIAAGMGQLSATEVEFAPNDNQQITKFTPIKPGKVELIANANYLPELPPAELTVVTPYGLLVLCGVGSLLGALLVYLSDKESATWKRLVVGFITGYVLYWALLFGIILIPNFPHAFLLNPFSAVILPLFGGWLGTKVITGILQRFGWQF